MTVPKVFPGEQMKLIYLIDSAKYPYHKRVIMDFTDVIPGKVLDMSDGVPYGNRYRQIDEADPNVVITLDLAGHVLLTGNGTLSLNNIYARIAHILFHGPQHYGRDLKARQNLSMFTYIPSGEDAGKCGSSLPEVPNVMSFVPFDYKADDEAEHAVNRDNIAKWWEEFKKDAML